MSKAKNFSSVTNTRIVIIAALALIIGVVTINYDQLFPSENPEPVAGTQAGNPGLKLPAGTKPGSTSGQGSMRSSGDLNAPQSLSGKPLNGPQAIAAGMVVDAKGQGIPDVRVQCTNCQTSAALALSDKSGNFKLPYHFEPSGDVQQMVITVSKGKQSSKHVISGNTDQLKLEL